jgi:hypothetical protein
MQNLPPIQTELEKYIPFIIQPLEDDVFFNKLREKDMLHVNIIERFRSFDSAQIKNHSNVFDDDYFKQYIINLKIDIVFLALDENAYLNNIFKKYSNIRILKEQLSYQKEYFDDPLEIVPIDFGCLFETESLTTMLNELESLSNSELSNVDLNQFLNKTKCRTINCPNAKNNDVSLCYYMVLQLQKNNNLEDQELFYKDVTEHLIQYI